MGSTIRAVPEWPGFHTLINIMEDEGANELADFAIQNTDAFVRVLSQFEPTIAPRRELASPEPDPMTTTWSEARNELATFFETWYPDHGADFLAAVLEEICDQADEEEVKHQMLVEASAASSQQPPRREMSERDEVRRAL